MIRPRLGILLALVTTFVGAVSAAPTKRYPLANTVVLIVRHAEKPEQGSGLTPEGEKRAESYVAYFKRYRVDGKPLRITHLFAAKDSKKSLRPRITLEPLSAALEMPIDTRFTDKDPDAIVQDLKANNYGGDVLICWRHEKIPGLLEALGVDPKQYVPEGKWPGDIYDRIIELHFDANGRLIASKSKLVLEHLMPGDEK